MLYLIILVQAEAGNTAGTGGGGRRMGGQAGADQFVMKIPNNKVLNALEIDRFL